MGNVAKRWRVQEGLNRPGSAARSRKETELEAQRQQVASVARERKARQKECERWRNEETRVLIHDTPGQAVAQECYLVSSSGE